MRKRPGFLLLAVLILLTVACSSDKSGSTSDIDTNLSMDADILIMFDGDLDQAETNDHDTAVNPNWYVDPVKGSDTTGNGSQNAPYKTIEKLWPKLKAGDLIGLFPGSYGAFDKYTSYIKSPSDLFSDWVTFIGLDLKNPPVFEHIHIGTAAGNLPMVPEKTGPPIGQFNAFLAFENVTVKDGVHVVYARHFRIKNSLITSHLEEGFLSLDPTFPAEDYNAHMRKTAVNFGRVEHFYVEQCEITNTGNGVAGTGININLIGNKIHHGRHDGIKVTGYWDSLIEGNKVYNFDDRINDIEAEARYPGQNAPRHADTIHIFVSGVGPTNKNITFRNNILYDSEGAHVQMNEYKIKDDKGNVIQVLGNEGLLFEGNIFGPAGAPMFNNSEGTPDMIFRHNTVCVLNEPRILNPGSRSGRGQDDIVLDNYALRIHRDSTGVKIYNNILGTYGADEGAQVSLFDYNLIQIEPSTPPKGLDRERAYGRFTIIDSSTPLVDPYAFDGVLKKDSLAINAGTRLIDSIFETDVAGTSRDNLPDLGAFEYPGLKPDSKSGPKVFNDVKTTFIEDFEDGHYNDIDPWLQAEHTQGMSWYRPESFTDSKDKYYVTHKGSLLDGNMLHMPSSGADRSGWMLSNQGASWQKYTFEFDCHNSYTAKGSGVAVLAKDKDNAYFVDISRDNGRYHCNVHLQNPL